MGEKSTNWAPFYWGVLERGQVETNCSIKCAASLPHQTLLPHESEHAFLPFSFLLSLLLASFHQHIFVGHILNPGIFISSEDTAVNRPKKSCPHGLWILVRKIDRKQIIYGRIYGMSDSDKSYGEKLNRQEKYEEGRRKQLSLGWSEKASKEVTG